MEDLIKESIVITPEDIQPVPGLVTETVTAVEAAPIAPPQPSQQPLLSESETVLSPTGVKVVEVEIEVDLDNLLIGDMKVLGRAQSGSLPMDEMVDFLDRIVKGGVSHRPMRYLSLIISKLGDAISESTNPGN